MNEVEPEQPGTIYNSLLYHSPDGSSRSTIASSCRRTTSASIWGQGDGARAARGRDRLGRIGGLICWENYMPLARMALYESGVEIYVASTADDGDAWQATLVHIARESRAYVISPCHFQRASAYPGDFPLASRARGCRRRPRRQRDPRARTAPTSRDRSTTKRASSTRTSTRRRSRASVSVSIRSATTAGRTCCSSLYRGDDATPSRRPSARSARS